MVSTTYIPITKEENRNFQISTQRNGRSSVKAEIHSRNSQEMFDTTPSKEATTHYDSSA